MTIEQRFAEVGASSARHPRFKRVAQQVVERLRACDEATLAGYRDQLYKRLWDAIVEDAQRSGDASVDAREMAWEGVIIDHIIELWREGPRWRSLTQDLIPVAA